MTWEENNDCLGYEVIGDLEVLRKWKWCQKTKQNWTEGGEAKSRLCSVTIIIELNKWN